MTVSVFINLLVLLFFFVVPVFPSTFLEVGHPVYEILEYLEARGCLPSAVLTVQPLSRDEVFRLRHEAEVFCSDGPPSVKEHLRRLRELFYYDPDVSYLRPLDTFFFSSEIGRVEESQRKLFYYRRGVGPAGNSGFRTGFELLAEKGRFSLSLSPSFESAGRGRRAFLREGYLVFSLRNFSFLGGRLSQRWGPGKRTNLILSENPYPFDLFLVTNSSPAVFLGRLVRFSFFVTRLERRRHIPKPYLWGGRVVAKLTPDFEIGFSRTALLGGKGRSSSLKTWWRSILGKGENVAGPETDEPGDQRFALDFKFRGELGSTPLEIYGSLGREHLVDRILHKWAFSLGLYLPVLRSEGFSARLEYTRTPGNWNIHHIYRSGYTYRGFTIGHPLVRKGWNLYGEFSYLHSRTGLEGVFTFDILERDSGGDERSFRMGIRRWRGGSRRGFGLGYYSLPGEDVFLVEFELFRNW